MAIFPKLTTALLLTFLGVCQSRTHSPDPSLVEIVQTTESLSILEELVVQAALVDFFSGSEVITVFAPTDTAFEDLSCNAPVLVANLASDITWDAHLTSLLGYHVIAGRVTSGDLVTGTITMLTEEDVSVDVSGAVPTLTDETGGVSSIVGPVDVMASNGVAHVIDRVLLPNWTASTIIDILEQSGDFTILLSLLVQTDLDCVLIEADGAGYTLFAPLDSAFEGVDASALTDEQIADILAYHVVAGVESSYTIETGALETVNGATVDIVVGESSGTVNGNLVQITDVLANNGVIHVIDQVLVPPV